MPHWTETVDYLRFGAVFFTLAALSAVYLVLRHILLLSAKLHPYDFDILNMIKVCLSYLTGGLYSAEIYRSGQMVSPGVFMMHSEYHPRQEQIIDGKRVPIKHKTKETVQSNSNTNDDIHTQIAFYSTLASAMIFAVTNIVSVLMRTGKDGLNWLPWYSGCHETVITLSVLFVIAKSLMYLVFISRLHSAFQGTIYAYPSWFFLCSYLLLCVSLLLLSVLLIVDASGHRSAAYKSNESKSQPMNKVHLCLADMPGYLLVLITMKDLICTIGIVGLFTRSLRRMLNQSGFTRTDQNCDPSTAELRLLPVKYTLISSVGVMSTSLSLLIFALTRSAFVVASDAVINILCLLIMNALWKPLFMKLCTPLLRCIARVNPELDEIVQILWDHHQSQVEFARSRILNARGANADQIMKSNKSSLELAIEPELSGN